MRLNNDPPSKVIVCKRIRILLSEMTPMLLDIVTQTIATQPDLSIIGKVGRNEDLPEAVERTKPDVIVTSDRIARREQYAKLLHERPRLKVLEIVRNKGYGILYEMHPRRVPLGELSPMSLLDVIRASARPNSGPGPRPP
jgi:DNA-binding NarL/FixJ family response regulator